MLGAAAIYEQTLTWLKAAGCADDVPPQLVEQYAMCCARWLQCEEMTSKLGFLMKGSAADKAVASTYVDVGLRYLEQARRLWSEIEAAAKSGRLQSAFARARRR